MRPESVAAQRDPLCQARHVDGKACAGCTVLRLARLQGPVRHPDEGAHAPFCFCPIHAEETR